MNYYEKLKQIFYIKKGDIIMSDMNYEVMEIENEELETMEVEGTEEGTESKGKFGLAALAIGGGLALVGLTAAGIKKLKKNKADKPKKPKMKLAWVPVEDEEFEDEFEDEVVETNDEDK